MVDDNTKLKKVTRMDADRLETDMTSQYCEDYDPVSKVMFNILIELDDPTDVDNQYAEATMYVFIQDTDTGKNQNYVLHNALWDLESKGKGLIHKIADHSRYDKLDKVLTRSGAAYLN